MTTKDYILLADMLVETFPKHTGKYDDGTTVGMLNERKNQWNRMKDAITDVLAADNPRFKRQTFSWHILKGLETNER